MKIAAWHKQKGDNVEWYEPLFSGHMDIVYMSKVFSFTKDYEYPIDADMIEKGGSGYCITLVNGKEVYDKSKDKELPLEIEHIYPDYSMYGITDTAYGFTTIGCPRGCGFCIVKDKEGICSHKVADVSEFWHGQKYIQIMDPNILASPECEDILMQLAETKAYIEFNQGLDIRLMTEKKAELLSKLKIKFVHFAWDRYQDGDIIKPKLQLYKDKTGYGRSKVSCYVLVGYDTTMEQNLERIYFLRSLDFNPYVMIYDKAHLEKGSALRKLQRWCNNKMLFWKYNTFEEYEAATYKTSLV